MNLFKRKDKPKKNAKERPDLKVLFEHLKTRDESNIQQKNTDALAPSPMGNTRETRDERIVRSDATGKRAPKPYDNTEAGTVAYATPSGLFPEHAALDLDGLYLPESPASIGLSSPADGFRRVEIVTPRADVRESPIVRDDTDPADERESTALRPRALSLSGNTRAAPPLATLENVVMTMKAGETEDDGKGGEIDSKLGDDLRELVAGFDDLERREAESKINGGEKAAEVEKVGTLGSDRRSETSSITSSLLRTTTNEEKRKGEESEIHHPSGLPGVQYNSTGDRHRNWTSASEGPDIGSRCWEVDARFLTETTDEVKPLNMNWEEDIRGDDALSPVGGSVEPAGLGAQMDNEDELMGSTDWAKRFLRVEDSNDVGSQSLELLTGYGTKFEEEFEQGDDGDFREREARSLPKPSYQSNMSTTHSIIPHIVPPPTHRRSLSSTPSYHNRPHRQVRQRQLTQQKAEVVPDMALVLFGVIMSVAWVYEFGVQLTSHIVEGVVGKRAGGWLRSVFSLEEATARREVGVNSGRDDRRPRRDNERLSR